MAGLNFLQKRADIVETTQDSLGGGSFVLNSGIYPAVINKAFLKNSSSSSAVAIEFEFGLPEGKTHSETIWVTNGAGENYYINKNTGKPTYLPGFESTSNIAIVAAGLELGELEPEDKVVEIYNAELKKKAPTPVKMFMGLVGKELILGLQKTITFKQAKNQVTGKYEDTAETRETNEIVNVFTTSGFTALEFKAGATEVDFINKFKEVYTPDFVRDRTKNTKNPVAGNVAPNQGVTTPTLFNK